MGGVATIRALLIDDDRKLGELLASYLEPHGVSVTQELDGPRGLARLAVGGWDVVLLDLMMPGMDGLEVCRRIRAGNSIPILMLTARGDETDRVVGLALGAADLEIDVDGRVVRLGGAEIVLTGIELDLLLALARRAGRVVPRDALLELAGRNDAVVGERTVDVHISHLRAKLGDDPRAPRRIKTVRGVGYVLVKEGG